LTWSEMMHAYTVLVHEGEEDEGGYWAEVVELPGCFGAGDTLEELEMDIKDAIESHILMLKELGRPVPDGVSCQEPEVRSWQVAVAV